MPTANRWAYSNVVLFWRQSSFHVIYLMMEDDKEYYAFINYKRDVGRWSNSIGSKRIMDLNVILSLMN